MQFDDLYGRALDLELNSNDSNTLYTSTRRQQAINDGYQEFAALTECFIRRSTLTVSCNVAEYVLSTISDFARISAQGGVEWHHTSSGSSGVFTQLAGFELERRDEFWLNRFEPGWRQSTTPTQPRAYYLRSEGGQLILGLSNPPKVGSSESAKLIVPYVARPDAMTASTQVPFTVGGNTRTDLVEYHQALPHYAAYKLLPLIGDMDGAKEQLAKFMGYVTRFLGNLRPKGGTHVTVARSYFREAKRSRGDDDREWVRNQWS
jgi:hypothetical protein